MIPTRTPLMIADRPRNLVETVPLMIGLVWQLHRAYDEQRPVGIVRPSRAATR